MDERAGTCRVIAFTCEVRARKLIKEVALMKYSRQHTQLGTEVLFFLLFIAPKIISPWGRGE